MELRACILHFDYLTKFVACEWFFNLVECDFFFPSEKDAGHDI